MENQEIERLAGSLKPSGTIERGEIRSVEQRGSGVAFRTQMKGDDIINQTVELPNISLTYNISTDTLEILVNRAPATPEQRGEVLHDVAYFLRKIQSRDRLSQNLLRKIESQLVSSMDDQERTIMGNADMAKAAIGGDATIVSPTPQFAMMERTTIERLTFNPADLEQKRHLPLPLWSIIAFAVLFLTTTIVLLVKLQ